MTVEDLIKKLRLEIKECEADENPMTLCLKHSHIETIKDLEKIKG